MTAEWGMKRMKTKGMIFAVIAAMAVGVGNGRGATNEVSGLLQKGLFEEEANRNLDAAIRAYEAVIAQTDKDRQFAATAIFRLAECYRKQGKINEANTQYQRILREFADQKELATLSRQQLGSAAEPAPNATAPDQYQGTFMSAEQIAKIKALDPQKRRVAVQQMSPNPVLNTLMEKMTQTEQELATLKSNLGEKHPDVTAKEALLKTIYQQVDDQVDGVLSRQAGSANAITQPVPGSSFQERLTAIKQKGVEDQANAEIERIKAMIKDSPDLINAPDYFHSTPLTKAVESDALKVVSFLLDNKADTEVRNNMGLTPLLHAAQQGQKEMVELLANRGANINATSTRGDDQYGFGALHFAAEGGDKAMVETLLGHGTKVDLRAANDVTPLMVAARKGFKTVAETLLAKGANINAQDSFGNTALAAAIRAGNKAIVEWLLANKADPNIKDHDGKTALFIAVGAGNKAIVELLLAHGADANVAAKDGKSSLFAAIDNGNLSMVEMLLSNKADVNLKTSDGFSPLLAAVNAKNFQIVESLLKQGADVNTKLADNHASTPRWTPLDAAVSLDSAELVKLLLDNHADPNARFDLADRGNINAGDCTPLILAARRRCLDTAKILLKHGAKANLKEKNGMTALLTAWDLKDRPMALLLLENKADPGMKYTEGRTLLHFAALDGNQDFAGLLLDHGAPVNATDDYGKTPLHKAVEKNSQPLVELLLAHGADVNAKDKDGNTPLDLRMKNGGGGFQSGYPGMPNLVVAGNNGGTPSPFGGLPSPYQWQVGTPESIKAGEEMSALLRQHGGVAEVDVATIRVMRNGKVSPTIIFRKDAAGYNHYTLHEIVLQAYGPLTVGNTRWSQWGGEVLKFPDFSRLKIHHLPENGRTNVQTVDLQPALDKGDCSENILLKWGDIVEIPETDHKVSEIYVGLPQAVKETLGKCVAREVTIRVKGQMTQRRDSHAGCIGVAPNGGAAVPFTPPGPIPRGPHGGLGRCLRERQRSRLRGQARFLPWN